MSEVPLWIGKVLDFERERSVLRAYVLGFMLYEFGFRTLSGKRFNLQLSGNKFYCTA